MEQQFEQYDLFVLTKHLNPIITSGLKGVILEKYNDVSFEVEFVKSDGTNYEYNSDSTFTIDISYMDRR